MSKNKQQEEVYRNYIGKQEETNSCTSNSADLEKGPELIKLLAVASLIMAFIVAVASKQQNILGCKGRDRFSMKGSKKLLVSIIGRQSLNLWKLQSVSMG